LIDVRRVRLARVTGAHGLDGELRVSLQGADPDCLAGIRTLWLAGAESDAGARAHALVGVAPGRRGECRLRLAGIDDRDAAEAARGLWLWARAADLPAPEPGEFYLHELVGCTVADEAGALRGVVRGIWATGGTDVLVIEAPDGTELLVPAAASLLLDVDVAARRIVVAALPGLFSGDVG
jgi:16S rRNA processing protein RimM